MKVFLTRKLKNSQFAVFVCLFAMLCLQIQRTNQTCTTDAEPFCKYCFGAQTDNCTACERQDYRKLKYDEGTQKQSCECLDHYYLNVAVCSECHMTCLNCEGPGSSDCTDCITDNHRGLDDQGNCSCLTGYNEKVPQDESCHGQCHYSCKTCTETTENDCLTCERTDYRYVYEGQCICFDGFFDDGSASQCQQCDNQCKTCTKFGDNCLTCDNSVNREFDDGDDSNSADNSCNCKQGFYDNEDATVCLNCNYQCQECYKDSSADCLECDNSTTHRSLQEERENISNPWTSSEYNAYLDLIYPLAAGKCLCDPRYYDNGEDQVCEECLYSCYECLQYYQSSEDCEGDLIFNSAGDADQCTECNSSDDHRYLYQLYVLDRTVSVSQSKVQGICECQIGYYDDEEHNCKECNEKCFNCNNSSSADNCLSCNGIERWTVLNNIGGYSEDCNFNGKPATKLKGHTSGYLNNDDGDAYSADDTQFIMAIINQPMIKHSGVEGSLSIRDQPIYLGVGSPNLIGYVQTNEYMNDLITTLEDDEPYLAYFKIDPSGEVTYYARGIFDQDVMSADAGDLTNYPTYYDDSADKNFEMIYQYNYEEDNWSSSQKYSTFSLNTADGSFISLRGNQNNDFNKQLIPFVAFSGNNLAILGPPNYYRENFDFQDRFKDSANHRELNTYLDWPSSAGFTSDCVCQRGYYDNGNLDCSVCDNSCYDCQSGDWEGCTLCDAQYDDRGYYSGSGSRNDSDLDLVRLDENFILQVYQDDWYNFVSDDVDEQQVLKIANIACRHMFGFSSFALEYTPYEQCPSKENIYIQCDGSEDNLNECTSADPSSYANTCISLLCSRTYPDSDNIDESFMDDINPGSCPCLPGYYEDDGGDCQTCDPRCKTCDGPNYNDCTSCQAKNNRIYNGQDNTCECKLQTVEDSNNVKQCVPCSYECLQCEDSDNLDICTACNASKNILRGNKPDTEGARLKNSILEVYDQQDETWYEVEADEGLNCLGLDYAHYLCDRLYNSSADDIGSAECSDYDYCMIIDCQRNENNDQNQVRLRNGILEKQNSSGVWEGVPFFDVGYEKTTYEVFGRQLELNQVMHKPTQDVYCRELFGESAEGTQAQSAPCNPGISLQYDDLAYCNQNDDYIEDCYLIDDADLGNLITEDNKYTSSDSCVHLSCRLPEPNDEDNVSADNGQCNCQYGFFDNNQVECQECSKYCDSCTNSSADWECDDCNSNYSHREFKNLRRRVLERLGEVYVRDCECQARWYQEQNPDESTNSADDFKNCSPCHYSCYTCIGSGDGDCYTCTHDDHRGSYTSSDFNEFSAEYPSVDDELNYPQVSVLNTDTGYCNCENRYFDEGSSECVPCDTTCLTCSGGAIDECLTCFSNTFRSILTLDNTCGCDHGYFDVNYEDGSAGDDTCQPCDPTCSECYDFPQLGNDSDTCTKCSFVKESRGDIDDGQLLIGPDGILKLYDAKVGRWGNVCGDGLDTTIANGMCQTQYGFVASADYFGYDSACTNDYSYFVGYAGDMLFDTSSDSEGLLQMYDNKDNDSWDWYVASGDCNHQCAYIHCLIDYSKDRNGYVQIMNRRNFNNYGGAVDYDFYLQPQEGLGDSWCECIDGYYYPDGASDGVCQQCYPTCMDCNGGTIDDCSTCDEKLHRLDSADDATSACVCDYRHSYYDVYDTASDSLMCQQWNCDNSCQECNETSDQDCIICPSGANRIDSADYTAGGECQCDVRYYDDQSQVDCLPCDNTCYKCNSSDDNDCYMCSTLDHRTLDSTSCPCDPRYYEDGTNFACGKCHYSCYTCDDNGGGNSNECITCSAGDHRHIYNADYCSCDDHYYDINDTFTCGECYSYCATCVDSNTNDDCLSCMNMTNFHRHYSEGDSNTKCPCDRHYYEVDYLDTSADDACAECHPTCQECYDFGSNSADCIDCNVLNKKRGSWFWDGYLTLGGPSNNILMIYLEAQETFGIFGYNEYFNDSTAQLYCEKMYENSDSAGYSWSSADCPCNSSDSGDQCMNTQISFGELSADWENYINEDIYFKPLVQHLKSQLKCIELSCTAINDEELYPWAASNVQDASSGDCECVKGFFEDPSDFDFGNCHPCHPTCKSCYGSGQNQCLDCETLFHRSLSSSADNDSYCLCDDRYFDTNDLQFVDSDEFRSPLCQPCYHTCLNCLEEGPTDCTECNTLDFRGTYKKYDTINHYTDVTQGLDSNYIVRDATTRLYALHLVPSSIPWVSTLTDDDIPTGTQYHLHYPRKGEGYPITYFTATVYSGECPALLHYFDDYQMTVDGEISIAKPCHYSCLTCDGSLYNQCLTCDVVNHRVFSVALSQCICSQKYYDNGISAICPACHYTCENCWDLDDTNDNPLYNCAQCNEITDKRIFYQENHAPNSADESSARIGYGQCACKDNYGDIRTGIAKCVACHHTCRHCKGTLSHDCASLPFHSDTDEEEMACYEHLKQHLTSITYYSSAGASSESSDQEDIVVRDIYDVILETYPPYESGICSCLTHNYKRADDYHCYECPKDCVDCAFESVSGSVNCSDCSADENRDITVVSNYAAHTEYDQSQQTLDTKTLGHTRNICQCLEGYYDGIYTSNDAKTCSLCHYSCKKCLNTSDATHCIECDTLIHRTANSGTDSGGNGLIRTKTQIPNLQFGQCYCDTHYYDVSEQEDCSECHYSCQNCEGSNTEDSCTDCQYNSVVHRTYVNSTNKCLCDAFFYDNGADAVCSTCHFSCYHCSGTESSDCVDCGETENTDYTGHLYSEPLSGHRIYDSADDTCGCDTLNHWRQHPTLDTQYMCVCQDRYYNASGSDLHNACTECHYSCLTCSGTLSTNCSTCTTLDNRNNSVSGRCQCDHHYYDSNTVALVFAKHDCDICDYTCWDCVTSNTQCTNCVTDSHRTLHSSKCLCDPFYYDSHSLEDATVAEGITCSICDFSCYHCSGTQNTNCTDCGETSSTDYVGHSYGESTSGHRIYDSTAHTCSCDTLNHWRQHPTLDTQYMCVCQDRYYNASAALNLNNACTECHYSCLTCSGTLNTNCSTCTTLDNRYLDTGNCKCDHHYYDSNTVAKVFAKHDCDICDYTCWDCVTSNTQCTNCVTGSHRTLISTSCVCDPFYYDAHYWESADFPEDEEGINCTRCHYTCYTCDGTLITNCLTCAPTTQGHRHYVTADHRCDCDSNYYDDNYHHDCRICDVAGGYYWNGTSCKLSTEIIPFCFRIDIEKTLAYPISIPLQPDESTGYNTPVYDACELYAGLCGPQQIETTLNSDTFVNAVYPQTVGPDLVVACTVCMKGYLLEPDFVNHAYKCVWTPATCPHSTIAKAGFCGACPDGCPDCEFGAVGTITHKVKCTTCDTLHYDMQNYWATFYFQVCAAKTGQTDINDCLDTNPTNYYYGRGGEQLLPGCYPCPDGCLTCYYDWDANNILCPTCDTDNQYIKDPADSYLCKYLGTTCSNGKYKTTNADGIEYCENCPCTCKTCQINKNTSTLECLTCYTSSDRVNSIQCRTFVLNSSKQCLPALTVTCSTSEYSGCPTNSCITCPTECTDCTRNWISNFPVAFCTACSTGFKISGNVCLTTSCVQGQRPIYQVVAGVQSQTCIACDLNCKFCQSDYNYLPPKELCYECYFEFHLEDGKCYQDLPLCSNTQYKLVIPDTTKILTEIYSCSTCPASCGTCSASNYKSQNSVIQCGTCATGYTMVSDFATLADLTMRAAAANFLAAYPGVMSYECINDFVINTFLTCATNQYKSYNSIINSFICTNCPTGCSTCSLFDQTTTPIQINCLSCTSLYYQQQQTLGYSICSLLPVCTTGQYAGRLTTTSTLMVCKTCPNFCTTCNLQNPNNVLSIQCLTCAVNYGITNDNRCAQLFLDSGNNCPAQNYDYMYLQTNQDATTTKFVYCMPCPLGCNTCALSGTTSSGEPLLKCFTCLSTYTLSAGTCVNPCPAPCAKCIMTNNKYPACTLCTAPAYNDCQLCAPGYNFNSQKICTLVTKLPLNVICSPDSYWDFIYQICRCTKLTDVYDVTQPTSMKCMKQNDYFLTCGSGNYKIGTNCFPCANNCGACIGASLSQCKACKAGFYLNKDDSVCTPCGSNCQVCASATHCLVCNSGFYKYIANDLEALLGTSNYYGPQAACYSSCPTGTLPNINSLYYLNQELFDPAFLRTYLSTNTTVAVTAGLTGPAIALGKNHEPIFTTAGVPWTYDAITGQPILNGKVVNLECNPCRYYCSDCIIGAFLTDTYTGTTLNANRKDCGFSKQCQTTTTNINKIVQVANAEFGKQKCVQGAANTLYITGITSSSLSVDGIQAQDKPMILTVSFKAPTTVAPATSTTTFWWELEQPTTTAPIYPNPASDIRIRKDHYASYLDAAISGATYTPVEYTDIQILDAEMKLWQNVVRNAATLTIPASNLKSNTIYKFRCKVIYTKTQSGVITSSSVYQLTYIPVRWVYPIRPFSELGYSQALIYNYPQEGLSGTVAFNFILSFVNVHKVIHSAANTPWTFTMNLTATILPANIASKQNYQFSQAAVKKTTTTLTAVQIQAKQAVTVAGVTQTQYFEVYRSVNALASARLRQLPSNSRILTLNPDITPGWDYLTEAQRLFDEETNVCDITNYDIVQDYVKEGTCQTKPEQLQIKNEIGEVTSTVTVNFCCQKGTCSTSAYLPYICKCDSGNQGIFCQIKNNDQTKLGKQYLDALLTMIIDQDEEVTTTIDGTDVITDQIGYVSDTLAPYFLNYLNSMVKLQWFTYDQISQVIAKLKNQIVPKLMLQDDTVKSDLLNLIESIRKSTWVDGFYSTQQQYLDMEQQIVSIYDAIYKNAMLNINSGNPEYVFTTDKGSIGIIHFQDLNIINTLTLSLSDETGQQMASVFNFDSNVIPASKEIIVQIIYKPITSQLAFSTDKQKLIANTYDITVYDPVDLNNPIVVENQSGNVCPISNTFTFTYLNQPSDMASRTLCVYFDETTQTYIDTGCTVSDQTINPSGSVTIKCCCKHLSQFTIGMVPSKPIKPPTPGGKKTHIDKVPAQGVSAGIIAIAIIIPLVVIIIIIIIVWYYKRQQKLKLEHNQVQPIGPGDEAKFAEKDEQDDEVKEFSSPPPEAKPDKIHVVLQEGKIPKEKPPIQTIEEIKEEPKQVVQPQPVVAEKKPEKKPEKIIENVSIVQSEKQEPIKQQETNLVVSANEEQMLNKFYMYDEQNPDISKLIKQKTQLKLKLKGKKGEKK